MRYLASLILAAGLAVGFGAPAQAQFASDLTCDFFVPVTGGGFGTGRCVPQSVLSGYHVTNVEVSGDTLTVTWNDGDNSDGTTDETTVFTAPGADGVVASGALASGTLTLTRTAGLPQVAISGFTDTHVDSATVSGTDLSLHLTDGTTVDATGDLPVVTGMGFTGTTLTLTRNAGLPALTVSGLGGSGGGAGTADGVVSAGTVSGTTLTLQRTESLVDVTITGLPSGLSEAQVDARIAPYARVSPSSQIADAQIPGAIARDTELPDVSGFLTLTQVDARVTSGALQPGDVTGGANVTVTTSTDGVTIASSGGGTADGVVDGGSVSSTTLTLTRTVGSDITITGLPSGGGDSGLTAVSSDSTLQGDGTAADPLGLTDVEVNQLDSVPGLLAKTADLSIEVISRTWTDGTDVAAGRLRQPWIGQRDHGRRGRSTHLLRHTRCHKRGRPA